MTTPKLQSPRVPSVPVERPGPVSSVGVVRYQMLGQFAASAWAPIWVARVIEGSETGRIVAIRRVGRQGRLDPVPLHKLALAGLSAKGVRAAPLAAVLDVVVTEQEVGVVSEYVEGEFLRSLQRRAGRGNRPIAVPVALRLVLDVTRATIAARDGWRVATEHDPSLRSAVHGGLTPDSVLVATYGEALFFDVGVGGTALSRPELADHVELIAYRAPEHLVTSVADERSDVFTLGVLLWELLSNRPLFGSPRWNRFLSSTEGAIAQATEEAVRARHRVLEMPIPRLDAVVRAGAQIPRDVATVVGRALERNPSDRHRSLDAFLEALEALGSNRFASASDVAAALEEVAGVSIQSRRIALATVTGHQSVALEQGIDSVRPTTPPKAKLDDDAPKAEELSSSPGALQSLDTHDPKPPPLPKRRRTPSIPDR